MEITEREAQLILDALAWEIRQWADSSDSLVVQLARQDFVEFAKIRGIESVVKGE